MNCDFKGFYRVSFQSLRTEAAKVFGVRIWRAVVEHRTKLLGALRVVLVACSPSHPSQPAPQESLIDPKP